MTPGMRIAAAVASGYFLGRRKKAKLAITIGAWIAGKKLNLNPQQLLTDLTQELNASPELSEMRDRMRDELYSAGRTMATTALTQQAGKWTSSLQERTERLQAGASPGDADEPEQTSGGSGKSAPAKSTTKSATTKSATTKSTANKSTTTRSTANKSTATKSSGTKSSSTASRKPAATSATSSKSTKQAGAQRRR